MINKKIILLAIFLISILTISTVNAAENDTQESVGTDEQVNVEDSADEAICADNQNEDVVSAAPASFTQLNTKINGNSDRDIYLDQNYTFRPGPDDQYEKGITISRSITVHGNGFTLDGANDAAIFRVNDDQNFNKSNVKIIYMDIIFINADSYQYHKDGGAIAFCDAAINCTFINNKGCWGGALYDGNAINCTFINNSAIEGGAIYKGYAINCTFINNAASSYGGAIDTGDAVNCTFTDNTAGSKGGAIYYGDMVNCTFTNNRAEKGGAIFNGLHGFAVNCTFTNNRAEEKGGAVYNGDIVTCNFTNNSAKNGGAAYLCDAYGCEFTNNHAEENGGAMYGDEIYYMDNAINCIFIGNSAKNGGAVYMATVDYSDFISNCATEKGGAMYNSTGSYCYFADNKAAAGGDDAYASKLLKYSTKMTVPSKVNAAYNNDNYLVISIKDQFDNLFIGYEVSINVGGKTTKVYTEEDGKARMSTKGLAPGTHNAKITFDGDSNFDKSQATSKIIIKKGTLKLTAAKKTFKKSVKTKKYTVTFKAVLKVIKNAKLTLKVKGKTYAAKIKSNGKATFKITKLTKKGKFKATVKFAGNKYYNAKTVKTQIRVK